MRRTPIHPRQRAAGQLALVLFGTAVGLAGVLFSPRARHGAPAGARPPLADSAEGPELRTEAEVQEYNRRTYENWARHMEVSPGPRGNR